MAEKLFSKKGFISKQKTFQPAIKNESIIDTHQIESHKELTSYLKEAASVDARFAEFSLVREHSVMEESGIQKGVSILQEPGLATESMLPEFDAVPGSSSGANNDLDQQLRSAASAGKGMASQEYDPNCPKYFRDQTYDNYDRFNDKDFPRFIHNNQDESGTDDSPVPAKDDEPSSGGMTDPDNPLSVDPYGRPAPDEGMNDDSSLDPSAHKRLQEALKNFVNPSSTPGPDGDYVTQHPDSLTSPDPSTLRDKFINWGDENTGWGNFSAAEFNPDNIVDPSVNWGDYYTDMGPVVNVGTPAGSNVGCSHDSVTSKGQGFEQATIEDHF